MRAIAIMLVVASVCVIGGCSGDALVVNINGTWAYLVEFNECFMFGFMKGGPSNAIAIDITQSGDQLSANFQDPQGVDWVMDGSISGYRTYMYWTGRSSEGRVVEIMSEGWIQGGGANLLMDGFCVVHYDSFGLCYNEQYDFWGDGSGIVPQTNPPPEVIIQQCPGVDIIFIMDTSGSMGDESQALCDEISGVEQRLRNLGLNNIRVQLLGITGGPTFSGGFSCLEDSTANRFGSTVPGTPPSSGPLLNSSEDWGSAVAVAAEGNQWLVTSVMPGSSTVGIPYVRIIVPISDEGPENGGGQFSCNQADTDSITNAIAIANNNNVIVSPIVASSPGRAPDPASCILAEATRLAAATSGTVSQSTATGLDMAQVIFDLIVSGCAVAGPG